MKYMIISLFFLVSACSTPQKSRTLTTISGFVLGAGVGAVTAPRDERAELHAMYWGGLIGLGTALVSNYYFDESHQQEKLSLENEKLKAEMDLIQNANKVLLKEGQGRFKGGDEPYLQSGRAKWKVYQIDQWVKDGPNRLYHRDRMVEVVPLEKAADK